MALSLQEISHCLKSLENQEKGKGKTSTQASTINLVDLEQTKSHFLKKSFCHSDHADTGKKVIQPTRIEQSISHVSIIGSTIKYKIMMSDMVALNKTSNVFDNLEVW